MTGLLTYFKERFPIPIVLLLSLGMAAMLIGVTDSPDWYLDRSSESNLTILALITLIFTLFLLRTRVTDEFKDAAHDNAKYPNRPVQRGVIKKSALVVVGFLAFAFEIVLVFALTLFSWSGEALLWYLAIIGYSILTAFEFFVGSWLEKHFNIYFILHQLIFVLFAQFGMALFRTDGFKYHLLAAVGFVFYMVIIEIARKYEIRRDAEGNVVRDTYLAVWGMFGSLAIVLLLAGLASWFFSLQTHSLLPVVLFGFLAITLPIVSGKPKLVQGAIFLNFFAQAAVVYFA